MEQILHVINTVRPAMFRNYPIGPRACANVSLFDLLKYTLATHLSLHGNSTSAG